MPHAIDCAELGESSSGRAEHHQRRPPRAVDGVLRHRLLRRRAVRERVQDLEALPLVEGLLLADPDHGAGVRAVGAAAQRHLVDDRGAVDQPADRADVGPGQRRVVEDRGVLLPPGVQRVEQVGAVHAERLGGGVQVEAVAGLVLHLGHQDRLAAQARRPADPVALGLHADDLGVRVLGDLAHQRAPVGLRHLVAGLDAALARQQRAEAPRARRVRAGRGRARPGALRSRCRTRPRGYQRLLREPPARGGFVTAGWAARGVGSPRYAGGPPLPVLSSPREARVGRHTVVNRPAATG